jgi:uncharacterized protein (TIGR03437 family)
MIRKSTGVFLLFLMCGAVNAATTNTTLTVKAAGALGASGLTATGTADLSGIQNGAQFSATLPFTELTSAAPKASFTITLTGGTITGDLLIPIELLSGQTSGTGSATVKGGTYGGGVTGGSFPSLAGTGGLVGTSITLNFSGPGSIITGGGGGTTGPTAPVIKALLNNYSNILPGLPNYGIAPGTLFVIYGDNLNSQAFSGLQSSATPGIPKALNGTSVTVTINGTTVSPALYYTVAGQVAAVLPSGTPVGTGTITLTNNNTPSAPFPIQVVASAFGILTFDGTQVAKATDANGNYFSASSSASPGQAIVLWGSGVGADTANDDTTYPLKQDNLTNIPFTVYIGGISANVAYRGRSQYPGVDQVVVTIPTNVTPGCSVSVVTVSGNVVSNFTTLPVAPNNGACSDPNSAIGGTTAINLGGKSSVNFGFVAVTQSTSAGRTPGAASTTSNGAAAIFQKVTGAQFGSSANSGAVSIGSCIVNPATSGTGSIPTITGLDAGTLTLNGPAGTVNLAGIPGFSGFYGADLPASAIPASGGPFTFNGSGGKDVGAFNTTVNFPVPLVWTNMNSITSVNRAQGVTVNWTGGAAGTYVQITGSSSATIGGKITSVSFTCNAPVSAGTFTVPSPVLLALPAGSGSLDVANSTNPQTFTASGLDLGYQFASVSSTISPSYN